jgi:hypothetical protein
MSKVTMKALNKKRLSPSFHTSSLKPAARIFLSAAITSLLTLTAVPSPGYAEESCSELLTNRCEVCHYFTRVCQKVQRKKGKSSWKRTVKNMVKQGAKLNKDEQKKLVTCLSKPTPEIMEFCGLKK